VLSVEPSWFDAFLPEVGLHDAGFFLGIQSLGTAAVASWLLSKAAVLEV
jgi:hypothetical protein